MRLRQLRDFEKPSIMIIPMIDIMFFLLVFFMMSSLSMVDMHSLGVRLPVAAHANEAPSSQYAVTLKSDGTLWLNGKAIDGEALMASAGLGKGKTRLSASSSMLTKTSITAGSWPCWMPLRKSV